MTYDEDVMEAVSECCVTGFTKWNRIHGKGSNSVPKMDTAVWPGYNSAIAIVAGDEAEECGPGSPAGSGQTTARGWHHHL